MTSISPNNVTVHFRYFSLKKLNRFILNKTNYSTCSYIVYMTNFCKTPTRQYNHGLRIRMVSAYHTFW